MNQSLANNYPRPCNSREYFAGSRNHFELEREILALSGKVWSEPWVAIEKELQQALHEQRLLALPAAQLFLVGLFPAAQGELVVVQLGIGRKDGTVACFPHAQAKVRVVKTDGEFLVVAANLPKYVAADHLTSARYGTEVAGAHGAGKIALALCKRHLCGRKLKKRNKMPISIRHMRPAHSIGVETGSIP